MLNRIQNFFMGMPGNLSRITSGSGFIPEIDGLRFLAIFPVVIMHFNERLSRVTAASLTTTDRTLIKILDNGHIGVYLFFAISGFILALPFGGQILNKKTPVPLSKYYLRRLTRLEPPYIIIMTLLFGALILVQNEDLKSLFPHYLASLFYLHRLFFDTWSPINPPTWTLEIEVQFYIIAPFLALLYFSIKRKWVRRWLIVILLVSKILVENTTTIFDSTFQTLPFVIQFFLIGIIMADIYLTEWKNGIPRALIFDGIAVVCLGVVFATWTWGKDLSWKFAFITALSLLFYGSFRSSYFNNFLKNKWVTAIGGMCYTIYLLHLALAEFFVMLYQRFVPDISFPGKLVLGLLFFLPFLFLISSVFFVLIEKPCMDPNWPKKIKAWTLSILR